MKITHDLLIKLYNLNLEELLKEASNFTNDEVEFCSLISARTGKCSQNCKYCAQSSHYNTQCLTHPLVSKEEVKNAALHSRENMATRFAIVTSGKTPDESDFDSMLELIQTINEVDGLKSCASIGILNV